MIGGACLGLPVQALNRRNKPALGDEPIDSSLLGDLLLSGDELLLLMVYYLLIVLVCFTSNDDACNNAPAPGGYSIKLIVVVAMHVHHSYKKLFLNLMEL